MSADEDLAWLRALHASLWPPGHKNVDVVAYRASRTLTYEEWARVEPLVVELPLVANMFSANMFGGYGMELLAHEAYPGTGPSSVLTLIETHFPNPLWSERPTLYERVANPDLETRGAVMRRSGCGRDDIWALFSKHTHAARNREWLSGYRMDAPRDRSSYDY